MRRSRRALPLLLAAALCGCGLFPREEKVLAPPVLTPPEVTYDTVEVTLGTIVDSITVAATFVPADLFSVTFRNRTGRLRRFGVSPGDTVKQGALVAELDTATLESQIAQARLGVRRSELLAERAAALGQDRFDIEISAIDVQIARLALADLQRELEESRLYAPASGVVVYLLTAREGDVIEAWRTVAQIADPKRLQVLYQGDRAYDFKLGMKVTVSYRDHEYQGEVIQCPGALPPDTPDEMREAAIFRVPVVPPGAERGDLTMVSVVRDRRSDVIVVSRDLVRTFLGRNFVHVFEDGQRIERTVELGLQTPTEVEVIHGLAPGELLIAP
jgi:membrane fusion protein, macrolide-specific efflux system